MKHPSETQLVLHASGDLPWMERWRVRRHLANCATCRSVVETSSEDREWLCDAGNVMPPGVQWNSLSREMMANIRVGLAAGECVAPPPAAIPYWRLAAVGALSMALLGGGWYLNTPLSWYGKPASERLAPAPAGVELSGKGGVLTLMGPQGVRPVYTSAVDSTGGGTLGARYVNDAGQVQIMRVYVE